jgi:CheY-like chemotaxis protein
MVYIQIHSEIGKGTSVDLYLPKATKTQQVAEKLFKKTIGGLHGDETILLVEDEENLRMLTANYLESLDYRVLQAENAAVALRMLQQEPTIQLLLTDIIMPGALTGPELVEKALMHNPKLKIVYMSGYPKKVLLGEYKINNEQHPILLKPFSRFDLAILLKNILNSDLYNTHS